MREISVHIRQSDVIPKSKGNNKEKPTVPFLCETCPISQALTRAGLVDVVVTGLAFRHTFNGEVRQVHLSKSLRTICEQYDNDQFSSIQFGHYKIDLDHLYNYEGN